MIKLIIFDLWETLAYRKGDFNAHSIKEMIQKLNLNISLEEAIKIFEKTIQTKKWTSKYEAYKTLCKNFGLKLTKENILLLISIRDNAENKINLYSFTIPLLKQLKKDKYKIGLISNSTIFSIEKIKKTELLKYINYPLFSFNVGIIKPNPKFFKIMLRKSKLTPNKTIMIGDKLNEDVLPPRKLGMKSIHFKNYSQLKKEFRRYKIIIK